MDSETFKSFLEANVMKLYPDAKDEPGKRVVIKCDGGPGRLDPETLLLLRDKGFYLYPSVPNSTHVTQECDQSFGLFKSVVREVSDDHSSIFKIILLHITSSLVLNLLGDS